MVLKDHRNARGRCAQAEHVPREAQAVHVKNVRRQLAQQFAEGRAPRIRRRGVAKWLKMVVHTGARQMLRMRASLQHRNPISGSRCGFGDVDQGRPRVEQLRRRSCFRIVEKTDLYDVQQRARHAGHKLMTRGSH